MSTWRRTDKVLLYDWLKLDKYSLETHSAGYLLCIHMYIFHQERSYARITWFAFLWSID
jgi:hypothetical protein